MSPPLSLNECISPEERRKRFGVACANFLTWLFLIVIVALSWGLILLLYAVVWFGNWLMSEYNVRKLQAIGTTAGSQQFPEISEALSRIRDYFRVATLPRVIIVSQRDVNAFALKFARKRVIVLFSETLEGVLDQPEELRFFLGHEIAHIFLDHGSRGAFEIYKPPSYKAARELTCDNCGCAVAQSVDASTRALKRLGVGNRLVDRLNDEYLVDEARYIYSGLTGWLLQQYLSYPPLGKRLENASQFCEKHQIA
jgi:Zn-dependent protease with chaperone function